MFIGHFAVSLAGRSVTPRTSLGTWFLSVQWLDLLWPVLLILGLEHVRIEPGNTAVTPLDFYDYPITHSLPAVIAWSVVFAVVYFVLRRDRATALLLGAGVSSHWLLDAVVHRPDLPLWPGGLLVGLDLWRSVQATLLLETVLFALGIWMYLRATHPKDRTGRYAFWSLMAFLYAIYLMNLFGPPPPSVEAIGYTGLAGWVFLPWGYWIDRHRISARQNAGGEVRHPAVKGEVTGEGRS